jgi:3-oxoacyl-[acyl-carrier protein] reductase
MYGRSTAAPQLAQASNIHHGLFFLSVNFASPQISATTIAKMPTLSHSLTNKSAIVTGASRGIGRAIAESLAAAGASVVVNHRNSAAQAAETVASIARNSERAGGRAVAIQADMENIADIQRLIDTTLKTFGALDIVVNNAGVGNRTAMAAMTEKEFDWTMAVNARGPMFAIQAAVPHMRDNGRIINISSCGTHIAQITGLLAVYQMSKGALEQLARCYMKELGARGITINTVLPGFVETELASDTPQEYKDALIARTALRRLGTAEEIASVVAFLATDAARWITGESIQVSGGLA